MIYHITTQAAWQAAKASGRYSPPSLANEGFIHCSRRDQVLAVANEFYRGQGELILLCIDEARLHAVLRWEAPAHPNGVAIPSITGADQFPHLYGPLNLAAVVAALRFKEQPGGFALPPDLP